MYLDSGGSRMCCHSDYVGKSFVNIRDIVSMILVRLQSPRIRDRNFRQQATSSLVHWRIHPVKDGVKMSQKFDGFRSSLQERELEPIRAKEFSRNIHFYSTYRKINMNVSPINFEACNMLCYKEINSIAHPNDNTTHYLNQRCHSYFRKLRNLKN